MSKRYGSGYDKDQYSSYANYRAKVETWSDAEKSDHEVQKMIGLASDDRVQMITLIKFVTSLRKLGRPVPEPLTEFLLDRLDSACEVARRNNSRDRNNPIVGALGLGGRGNYSPRKWYSIVQSIYRHQYKLRHKPNCFGLSVDWATKQYGEEGIGLNENNLRQAVRELSEEVLFDLIHDTNNHEKAYFERLLSESDD